MPFLLFDCYPEQKSRNQTKKTTNRQIKEKKISMLFGVDLALDSKNIGLILRLKIKASWVPV